ncbi:hypothetical protein B7P34_13430 [Streptosporangium nondiastaticum]|uniref:DUF2637 domain-containing protein n=1 Tax=Streptosporangium nondiastaticum TaxID=35764 RepID=A0A9X7JR99_9ACTN|nr:DUF2637 domain-containing protein [Streptosporangium nondiastaticum]PSJ28231.1 hypothetical protein B7P34_13430 [Streptosporangium nondiastaticum]
MTAPTDPRDNATAVRHDWPLAVGMGAVGLAAAASSYAALQDLALRTSWWPWLSWLLPVTVDAYALTAVRVWLGRSTRSRTARTWAKANAIGGIALSVAGNAVDHAAAAGVIPVSWPLIVAASAIPPVVLGLLVHMAHLRHQTPADSTPDGTTQHPAADGSPPLGTPPAEAEEQPAAEGVPAPPAPVHDRSAADARPPKPRRDRRTVAARRPRRALPSGKSDEELIAAARERMADGGEASATWLMKTYGIGTGRAARIRDTAQCLPRLAPVRELPPPPATDEAPPPAVPELGDPHVLGAAPEQAADDREEEKAS